jgi:threonine-phosphate decarboxylase
MKGFIDYVVRRSPRYTFVVDQSYEAYTQEELLVPSEAQALPNLLVLHSMSKTYAIPGLRLGYITAHPNTIQLLRTQACPWSVTMLAMEAGRFLLEQGQPAIPDLTAYLKEAERLRTNLRKIAGIRVFETKTNFMLCELEHATAKCLKEYLVERHGILIRDCSNFPGLSTHFFRVTAQHADENDQLVDAIRQFADGDRLDTPADQ